MKKLIFIVTLSLLPSLVLAENSEVYIPSSLQPWIQWVKEGNPDYLCPTVKDSKICDWPGKLYLDLRSQVGKFSYEVFVDRRTELILPGGNKVWPIEVKVTSKGRDIDAILQAKNKLPYVLLEAGQYTITGGFLWEVLPKSLLVPQNVGILDLSISGQRVKLPKVTENGEVWLGDTMDQVIKEEDRIAIDVQRKLVDGIPFTVITHLGLRISGKSREISLGKIALANSKIVKIDSDLPFRLDQTQNVFLQVRQGSHFLTLEALLEVPPNELQTTRGQIEGWPDFEIWAWAPNEKLRSVLLSGAQGIDPSQTTIPESWKSLTSYLVQQSTKLVFKETRRGLPELAPNQLQLNRKLWLDIDGGGFTAQDNISGIVNQGWRLNSQKNVALGRVSVNGREALITNDLNTKLQGVELRQQNINLVADLRIEDRSKALPAVGWDHDLRSLNINLNLPPGWRLFATTGVDQVNGTWISNWTLLDFFFVLLIFVSTTRLINVKWGALVLIALVLSHAEPGAPFFAWFNLLICLALKRVFDQGKVKSVINLYFGISLFLTLLQLIGFSVLQIRMSMFPQLGINVGYGRGFFGDFVGGLVGEASIFIGMGILIVGGYLLWTLLTVLYRKGGGKKVFAIFLGLFGISVGLIIVGIIADNFSTFRPRGIDLSQQTAKITGAGMPSSAPMSMDGIEFPEARRNKNDFIKFKQLGSKLDPNAVIQTGPGVPSWNWGSWNLNWNGPVKKDHNIRLFLLGPKLGLIFAILRVVCFFSFILAFVEVRRFKNFISTLAMISIIVVAGFKNEARADDFPSPELLNDLNQRISRGTCTTDCTSVGLVKLKIEDNKVFAEATVSSVGFGAWAIPGPVDQIKPIAVNIDGIETNVLRRDKSGYIWVRLPSGTHQVQVTAELLRSSSFVLSFALPPGHVEITAPDWAIDGLSPTGSVEGSIQLTKKVVSKESKQDFKEEKDVILPNWFMVTRELTIGIPWTVVTTVERLGDISRPVISKIPLIEGESLTSVDSKLEGSNIVLEFSHGVSKLSWTGELKETDSIELKSQQIENISEVWRVQCSEIWHCSYQGITPNAVVERGQNVLVWHPYPNEKVKLVLGKPLAEPGQSVTIENVFSSYIPGTRALDGILTLTINASRSDWEKLILPEEAEVSEVNVDNNIKPSIRPNGRELLIPIDSGRHSYQIKWQVPWKWKFLATMPKLDLGRPAVNINSEITWPRDRWLLFSRGPAWGPVILFWSNLILVLILGGLLGKTQLTPLSTKSWWLLGLGLGAVDPKMFLFPILWFLLFNYRRSRLKPESPGFNAIQLLLIILTLIFAQVLFSTVYTGLLFDPSMAVVGNGSTNYMLKWYLDRIVNILPMIQIFSVPIWIYRIIMLLWATWLSYSVLEWIKWGWGCFSNGGVWRRKKES